VCRPSAGCGAADFSETDLCVSPASDGDVLVDVGTPHRVRFVSDLLAPEVTRLGREWSQGMDPVNATFVEPHEGGLRVRTLERGVDRETQSCGTGALAAYLACRETRTGSASNGQGCQVCFVSKRRLWVGPGGPPMTVRVSGACRLLRSGTPEPRATLLGAPELAGGVRAWFAQGGG
jgi:hypothetical protein